MFSLRRTLAYLLTAVVALTLAGCGSHSQKRTRIVCWGFPSGEDWKGLDAAVAEFERRHPEVEVKVLSMGAGNMNPQKLMTAIVGKAPPDIIFQNRFTINDWASRDTFTALDDLIARDRDKPLGVRSEDFYDSCWVQTVYKGRCYAVPFNTDSRALIYNRRLFREAGLDPDRPPRTWEELRDYAVRLTKRRPDGGFERVGFMPNFGNSWLYLYSWQNEGEFMSADGRTCTLDNPRTVEALDYMVSVYDALDGVETLNSFASGFKAFEFDPFLTGLVAMEINGDQFLNWIARYGPELDFGVAPAPVPSARLEGKPPFVGQPKYISWGCGFSLAIPRGARHVEESWGLIKWLVSPEAMRICHKAQSEYNQSKGRSYVPWMTANAKVNEMVFRDYGPRGERYRRGLRIFLDLLKVSKHLPVTFVSQKLWDEQVRAFDQATHHKMSSKDALRAGARNVQQEMDKHFARERYPVINWIYPIGAAAAASAGIAAYSWRRLRAAGRRGRLAREETVAGVIFASPWILGFLVFTIGPILASFLFSFCDYDVLHPARWVGLANYRELLTSDWGYVSKCLYNVGYLALFGIPLGMAVSLAIAMLLNSKVGGMTWYRTTYYLPSIVPPIANMMLWIWILHPEFGLLNAVWRATISAWAHVPPPAWFASEHWAKPALVLMGLWGAGGGMILWLAGLQGVPQHLYEAAEIDGAGWWSRFRHVTLPMLTPYLFFNLIMGTIGVVQSFDAQYILGGQPVDSTMVPVLYLFNNAFAYFKMGYASALAWLLFVIILALTLIQLKLAPRWVHYEHDRRG